MIFSKWAIVNFKNDRTALYNVFKCSVNETFVFVQTTIFCDLHIRFVSYFLVHKIFCIFEMRSSTNNK